MNNNLLAKSSVIAGLVGFGIFTTQAQSIILYQAGFSGSAVTPLNGTAVDTSGATPAQHAQYGTVAGETWTADSVLFANGQVTSGDARGGATLAFTPQNGYVYTLTMTTSFAFSSADWVAVGFNEQDNYTDYQNEITGGVVWALTRPGQGSLAQVAHFNASGSLGNIGSGNYYSTAPSTLTIVLDTTLGTGDWSAKYYAGTAATGNLIATQADMGTLVTGIHSISLGWQNSNASTKFDFMELSVTANEVAPTLVGRAPGDGDTGVALTVKPTATFSEGVILENGGLIVIRNLADGTGLSDETITLPDGRVSVSGPSLVIDPAGFLMANTPYAIRISGDAVRDGAGNFFTGIGNDTEWNFTTGAAPAPTPPNVLFITLDDLNTRVGPLGEFPEMLTPQMNRLAAGGVTFKRAYCQAPICGPSRVSFMSGLRPSTTGEYSLDSKLSNHPTYGAGSHKSLHEFYKNAGYTTASIGKIYHTPSDLGSWLDLGNGNHNYGPFPPSKLTSTAVSGTNALADWGAFPANDNQLEDYGFVTWALDRIENFSASPEKPFFLSVGMTQPHLPLFAPQAWFDLYPLTPTLSFTRPFYDPNDLDDTPRFARYLHWDLIAPRTEKLIQYNEWDNHTRAYLACVSYADMNLGRLLNGLDDPNGDGDTSDSIRDNTIVVMFSDHGYHLGEKGMTSKRTLWDVGTRVPLIISAPGMAEGQMSTQPVELLDLYPTLLDLCGLGPYAPLEGLSLRPQLENPGAAPWRRPAITTSGPNNHGIVDERYRYIRYADGSEELYDHAIDPNEASNRINDPNFREVAARLADFIPTVNTPHTPGEVSSITTIGSGGVISYSGSPINDTELGINPAVANYVNPMADEPALDLDEDLMPDWWEEHYTGTTTELTIDGNFDGDPVPDKEEYRHGTDPTDPDSYLKLSVEADPGGQSFRHTTVPGRDYRFRSSGDLTTWTTDGTLNPGTGNDVMRSSGSLGLPANRGFIRVEVLSEAE